MRSYSRRLIWDAPTNPISRLVRAKAASGERLIDLTVPNPTHVFPDYPYDAIRRAFGELPNVTYEPDALGLRSAREAIAEYYRTRAISASADRLILTASTSEAYGLLFKLFCDPGDEVLIPVPSYPLFEYLAGAECVRTIPYRLLYDGAWHIDFDSLESQISSRTRAIVVVNPNNPTGSLLKRDELERLLEIGGESGLPLIADEVFLDYPLDRSGSAIETLIGSSEILTFSLNGLSKAAGMPQMKAAWIAINGPELEAEEARSRLELLADNYLSVNTPVQLALPQLFEIGAGIQETLRNRTRANLQCLKNVLAGTAAGVLHTEAGWSAILQLPNIQSEESWVTSLIEEQHVLAQPGYFFDMASEPYLVLSLITPPGDFEEGICRLQRLITQY